MWLFDICHHHPSGDAIRGVCHGEEGQARRFVLSGQRQDWAKILDHDHTVHSSQEYLLCDPGLGRLWLLLSLQPFAKYGQLGTRTTVLLHGTLNFGASTEGRNKSQFAEALRGSLLEEQT